MQNNLTPASQAQINYLKKLGYTGETEGLTSQEASMYINQLKGQQQPNEGYSSPYQGYSEPTYPEPSYQAPAPKKSNIGIEKSQMELILQNDELANGLFENLTTLATSGQLYFPKNYSIGNALKSAMFAIINSEQSDKLLACTNESKKQALTEYIIQGLDAGKKQAYFIPYGEKLGMMRSYFGDVAVTKATGLVKDVYANVIYEGDNIVLGFDEVGREILVEHSTKFENRDNPIKGVYACAVIDADHKIYTFMTWKEVQASWGMSKAKDGKFLKNFQQEGCKRTAIRRLVKMIFNTSLNTTEQQETLIASYNRSTEDEYDNDKRESLNAEVRDSNLEDVRQHQAEEQATIKVDPANLPRKEAPKAAAPAVEEDDNSWMN